MHTFDKLHSDCTQIVLRLYSDCTQIVLRLYSDCTQIVLRLYSDCTQIVLRVYSDCTQIVLRLAQTVIVTTLTFSQRGHNFCDPPVEVSSGHFRVLTDIITTGDHC